MLPFGRFMKNEIKLPEMFGPEIINQFKSLWESVTAIDQQAKLITNVMPNQMTINMIQHMAKGFSLIRPKWTLEVLLSIWMLETPRFSLIASSIPELNNRTLSMRLSSLEEKGIIDRSVSPTKPVEIRYSISEKGIALVRFLRPFALVLFHIDQDQSIDWLTSQ